MLLFADILKNPKEAPIQEAALWIQKGELKFVGKRSELPEAARQDPEKIQLENAAVFPGLINAHCHLELTDLEGLVYPGNFVDWIRQVLQAKNHPEAQSSEKTLQKGILRTLLGGTTTVGDHISCTAELPVLLASPLRGCAFLEVLGVVPEVAEEIFKASCQLAEQFANTSPRWTLHPSPHSVHALTPEVLGKTLQLKHGLFSIHLGESQAEADYFSSKISNDEMSKLISERGEALLRPYPSALFELTEKNLLSEKILAIHGNYFSEAELKLCAQHHISLVHCPLSHQYFGHRDFPMQEALAADVNLALGTDSLASADSLSMLDVLRATEKNFPQLAREQIFSMATSGGAKALKLAQQVGSLEAGKKADVIGIRLPEARQNLSPLDALFAAPQVEFVMIDGEILIG